jgi:putative iron-regulated protein
MKRTFHSEVWAACLVSAGLVTACGVNSEEDRGAVEAAAVESYAELAQLVYKDSLTSAKTLQARIDELVAAPTESALEAARAAWLDSREPYLQTEVFRFYDGPIDNPEDGPEGLLNAWPLDEAYIDYVEGAATLGIIGDADIELSAETLTGLNELGGEENIATGYHAIEFLLWGQDLSETGPGARPATDYDATAEAPHSDTAERRATYLQVVGDLLVTHLASVETEWQDKPGRYREGFVAEPRASLRDVLVGMFLLAGKETGGERLSAALDTGKQEDEHSCFSDNTHRDMIQDVQGMLNVWKGTYKGLSGAKFSGTGLAAVAATYDSALASDIDEQLAEAMRRAKALEVPFDREIATDNPAGRERVEALSLSLRTLSKSLEKLLLAMGFEAVPEE